MLHTCRHDLTAALCVWCCEQWRRDRIVWERKERRRLRDERLKDDIIQILGKLIGLKAIDEAQTQ